jgi:hypothetical protein
LPNRRQVRAVFVVRVRALHSPPNRPLMKQLRKRMKLECINARFASKDQAVVESQLFELLLMPEFE